MRPVALAFQGGKTVLVLTRKELERIVIGDDIEVMVLSIRGGKVRLGISAPRDVPVHRYEVAEAIRREESEEGAA